MAIEGSLSDVGLADICQLLAMGRKTGCLTVTDRSNFGYVYFEDGRVIYASVLNRPDRLGDLMVRNGVITRDQLSEAMQQQAHEPGKRLGQILISSGALSEEDLERYISIQIEEAVYHLFTWDTGSFHFDADEAPDADVTRVSISADSLLLEGARRVDEWTQIEKKIPSFDLVFTLAREPSEEDDVEITSAQTKVLSLLDGSRTVEEVIEESGLVEFEAAKALFGLIQAGFAEQTGRREAAAGAGSETAQAKQHLSLGMAFYKAGMFEDAGREFEEALSYDPHHPRARFRLGLIALKNEKPEEALAHFEAMPEEARQGFGFYRNKALVYEELGRFDDALEVLAEADRLRPGHPLILLNRGILLLKAGDAGAAKAAFDGYRKLLGKQTPPPMYYNFAILAAAMSGDWKRSVALGSEGLQAYPEDGSILVNAGAVLEARKEEEAAEALFLRAVKLDSPPPQAHKNLGDQAYQRGDQASARAHYERAVKLDAKLGDDVYLKLGQIAYEEDDREWAMLLWKRSVEINPENEAARTNIQKVGSAPGR